jgi:hypothetical protein
MNSTFDEFIKPRHIDNVLFLVNKYCSYLLCDSMVSQLNSQTGIP